MPPSNLTESIRIPQNGISQRKEVSRSMSMSTSPDHVRKMSFSATDSYGTSPNLRRMTTGPQPKQLKPFREQDIKVLLLENVNQTGRDILKSKGYQVEALKSSLPEDQLIVKIKYVEQVPALSAPRYRMMKYFGCKSHRPVPNTPCGCFRCLPPDYFLFLVLSLTSKTTMSIILTSDNPLAETST